MATKVSHQQYFAPLRGIPPSPTTIQGGHFMPRGGNDEWYTPAYIITPIREVMGEIDLDPASCELANETVKATTFYTLEDDGMMHDWHGRVFLNPPYSGIGHGPETRGTFKREFIAKLEHHYLAGDVEEAILVCPFDYSPKWGDAIRRSASALCQLEARKMRFYGPWKSSLFTTVSSQIVYFGPHVYRFHKAFQEFGLVVQPIR